MTDFAQLVARLTLRAAAIAETEARRRRESGWWRKARLLWPNFTKGLRMEVPLRAALVAWLAEDPVLTAQLNAIAEEAPSRTALPWLALAASASADWSTKTTSGREVRVALELHCRGDRADAAALLVGAIEARVESLPSAQGEFTIASLQFLRARAEQRAANTRLILLEYCFRLIAD